MRIGLQMIGGKKWMGAVSYIGSIIKAVRTVPEVERETLYLIVTDNMIDEYKYYQLFDEFLDGYIFVGKQIEKARQKISEQIQYYRTYEELYNDIDFIYPNLNPEHAYISSAAWIPDFQHRYLPEFFSERECVSRNNRFKTISEQFPFVVFSSLDAEKDFRKFYPDSKARSEILSFHIVLDEKNYDNNFFEVQKKYNLPNKFLLCCNQFWVHKNHKVLFKAISMLRECGQDIHLVCTGSTHDYRSKDYFNEIQKYIHNYNIEDLVHITGIVSRDEQIQLMRLSLAIVQPSLFEGWSTIVEESRTLGKTIILADLDVNFEQNPQYGIYFKRNDAEDLVEKLKEVLKINIQQPHFAREDKAKQQALILTQEYGRIFYHTALEITQYYSAKKQNSLDKSVLIVYNSQKVGQENSETYQSIVSQTHPNKEIFIGSLNELQLENVDAEFICFVKDGVILDKIFLEVILSNVEDKDIVYCNKKLLTPDHTAFYKAVQQDMSFLEEGGDLKKCVNPCVVRKKAIENDWSMRQRENSCVKVKQLWAPLVCMWVDKYIRQRLFKYKQKHIYFYGAGEHTKELLQLVDLSDYNICGIIDKNDKLSGLKLEGYMIFNYKQIRELNIDVLLISSAAYEEEIYNELREILNEDTLIRIYSN